MTDEELKQRVAETIKNVVEGISTAEDPYVPTSEALGHAEYIHNLYKQAGYVQLDPDQSLPENPYSPPLNITEEIWGDIVIATHRAMLKAGFKKVKLPSEKE